VSRATPALRWSDPTPVDARHPAALNGIGWVGCLQTDRSERRPRGDKRWLLVVSPCGQSLRNGPLASPGLASKLGYPLVLCKTARRQAHRRVGWHWMGRFRGKPTLERSGTRGDSWAFSLAGPCCTLEERASS